jgi:hypothetical protein
MLSRRLFLPVLAGLALSLSAYAASVSHVDKLGHRYEMPAHQSPGSRISKSYPIVSKGAQKLSVGSFDAVNATGNVDLTIHGRVRSSSASVKTHETLMPDATAPKNATPVFWVRHRTLYINNPNAATPLYVVLNMPRIRALMATGSVHVVSDHLKSRGFVLNDNSSRDVFLSGIMDVDKVAVHGSGNVYVRWVQSQLLQVNSNGTGMIRMAGVARDLRVRLYGNARFEGQYLRANDVMVRTAEVASANVFPVKALQAFAYDYSNVFFYHSPISLNRMTMQSGNILQAGWRL